MIDIEEKIRRNKLPWKGEQIVDICHNVRHAYGSVHTIHDNTDRVKVLKCVDKIKCQQSEKGNVCLCSKTTTFLEIYVYYT
jgi:hypothetical protein